MSTRYCQAEVNSECIDHTTLAKTHFSLTSDPLSMLVREDFPMTRLELRLHPGGLEYVMERDKSRKGSENGK